MDLFSEYRNRICSAIRALSESGVLPESLGRHTNLRVLGLGATRVSGTVPRGLGDLVELVFFNARHDFRGQVTGFFTTHNAGTC